MFFDKMPHDSEISLGESPKVFDNYEMSFNYKFSSSRFEKWVPKYVNSSDASGKPNSQYSGGGQYSYLTNDRMDPYQIKTSETGDVDTGNNTISANAPQPAPQFLESFYISDPTPTAGPDAQNPENPTDTDNSGAELSTMDQLKMSSAKAAKNLAKNLEKSAIKEVNTIITSRARLLNNTIDKIRNSLGIGRMRAPTNIYFPPGGASNINSRFFYDVHNNLRDFLGESLGGAMGS